MNLSNIGWGITIDMRTGELARIEDVISLSKLQETLDNNEFKEVRSLYGMDTETDGWYEAYLTPYIQGDTDHNYDFYLKKDKIGLLFSEARAAGNYSIVEIDRPGIESSEPQGQQDAKDDEEYEFERQWALYPENWNWKDIKAEGLNEELLEGVVSIEHNIYCPDLNSSGEDMITDLLEKDVREHCAGEFTSYDIECEVTYLDEDYVSVLYQGTMETAGETAPAEIAWGTTVDVRTGEMATVKDVADYEVLQKNLEGKNFKKVRGFGIEEYEKIEPANWYKKYENLSMDASDTGHYHDFYLNQNHIGILFGVSHEAGDYILVETGKTAQKDDALPGSDLASWIGRYTYLGEFQRCEIEIQEEGQGTYAAELSIEVAGREQLTKLKADVELSDDKIKLVFKECLTGEPRWESRSSEVLLKLGVDLDTGKIYTYWGELNGGYCYVNRTDEEGEICFNKE